MKELDQHALTIQCPKCGTRGRVKASSIPPQGARFACPKCQHRFRVRHKSFPLSPGSTDHGRIENSKFAKTPLAGDTKDTGLPGAPVSHQARPARRPSFSSGSVRWSEAVPLLWFVHGGER
ncbi:MAG: zinc-ribbon domain-containing protein [Deltaproteobacteria bacterium]|nr:zinc-ribbon domain-containing protein [Deltaproteobacteria bacterium]